jgi:hypothetical protein
MTSGYFCGYITLLCPELQQLVMLLRSEIILTLMYIVTFPFCLYILIVMHLNGMFVYIHICRFYYEQKSCSYVFLFYQPESRYL